jgi:hypothetical protein
MRQLVVSIVAVALSMVATASAFAGPNDIAIVIANQNYKAESDVDDVPYAIRDGEAFLKAAVEVLGVPNVPGRNVLVVKDAALTTMRALFAQPEVEGGPITGMIRDKKARIFVYYSGHGAPVPSGDGRFSPVLLPVGVRAHEAQINGFALDEIRTALLKMRQRFAPEGEVFLILDACFSGRSAAGEIVKYASAGAVPASLAPRPGITEIAAAQGDQVAWWDQDRAHGLFTDTFVDALYTADDKDRGGNGDGVLTMAEIETFVQEHMTARLSVLTPEGRRQRAVFPFTPELVVANIATPPAVRDPVQLHLEATQCKLLEESRNPQEIDKFVRSCRTCTRACTTNLTQRARLIATERQTIAAACEADRRLWTDVVNRNDLDTVKLFAAKATCVEVKADVERWIAEQTAAAARKKAEEEAALARKKQEAEQAALKKIEDDRTRDEALARCDFERGKFMKLASRPLQGPITRLQTKELYDQVQCPTVKTEIEDYMRRKRWMR